MDKEVNLLFSINRGCINLLQTCLKSINLNGGAESYQVYVLHSDLTPDDKIALLTMGLVGMEYHFVSVSEELFDGFPTTKRYPEQIYYRLAAPVLLPKHLERILYLDVDTIVINSLLPLYESDFGDDWFMACTNTGENMTRINRIRLGLNVADDVPYVNTGVLLMNLQELRDNLKIEDIRKYAQEKRDILILPDQDILTALYGNRVKIIDRMFYNLSDRTLAAHNVDIRNTRVNLDWVRKNTVIIHYFGRNKPWKNVYAGVLDVFYEETSEKLRKDNCCVGGKKKK